MLTRYFKNVPPKLSSILVPLKQDKTQIVKLIKTQTKRNQNLDGLKPKLNTTKRFPNF